jgi:fucokinase
VVGKLFSPVPRQLPDGRPSTLFDELFITLSALAPRLREGMVLLSGDALLLFNPLQVDHPGRGVSALSFKAPAHQGEHHGVYTLDGNGHVAQFLHKQPMSALEKVGAIDSRGMVDIDTGALIFSPEVLRQLLDFSDIWQRERLSLYGDFLYPMAEGASLEAFLREPGEEDSPEALVDIRKQLWNVLRPHRLRLLRLAPAQFLHFGTTGEVMDLMTEGACQFRHLGWQPHTCAVLPSHAAGWCAVAEPNVTVGTGCYLESCRLRGSTRIGNRVFLSGLEITDREIPGNLVIQGLRLRSGDFTVRLWALSDDPKSGSTFLGIPLKTQKLWDAPLFPVKPTMEEALDAALALYADPKKLGGTRISLAESFRQADPEWVLTWNKEMEDLARMERLKSQIAAQVPASQMGTLPPLTEIQKTWLREQTEDLPRLEYSIGKAIGGQEGQHHIRQAFRHLRAQALPRQEQPQGYAREETTVRLPLRVNWGGGWSDTPPYCQDRGGTVLNAAITLGGKLPVEVTAQRITEAFIRLSCDDLGVMGEFHTWETLASTGDPGDPFALPKAALSACGIAANGTESLESFLSRLGGGFHLRSRVLEVPKGSGLGTSSILCAACAQAILELFGIPHSPEEITRRVLVMEQLMDTGGGWQDQVGGLFPGIKLIRSHPGTLQNPRLRPLEISEKTQAALDRRFALIYTGQRRLARKLLREVVGRYLGREPEALDALEKIQELAVLMAFQLERGNLDAFGDLLNRHWALSQTLDPGCANTLIHQIFASVADLIHGQMICGAGGGGFLQVLLKENVTQAQLEARLRQIFHDNPVAVWPCRILWS